MTVELINEAFQLFRKCYEHSESNPHNMRLHHVADRAWKRYIRRIDTWTHAK